MSAPAPAFVDCFTDLTDPLIDRTKRHRLRDVLTITLCGVLGGAENWVEVAQWAKVRKA